ncbi:MAG: hypothetical protein EXR72_18345 [Myxococcales bacterium]|nr:hypothetical protein [Myxococcales bacterium]
MRAARWIVFSSPVLLCAVATAAVAVPPFSAPDDLAIFAPEVARAVSASLERSGVDVSSGGAPIAGKIEALDRDRVRLRATVAGRAVQVEGALEQVDELAADLGTRIAAALPASARRAVGVAPPARATMAASPVRAPDPISAAPAAVIPDRPVDKERTAPRAAPPIAERAGPAPPPTAPATTAPPPPPVDPPVTPAAPPPPDPPKAAPAIAGVQQARSATPAEASLPVAAPAAAAPPAAAPPVVTRAPPAPVDERRGQPQSPYGPPAFATPPPPPAFAPPRLWPRHGPTYPPSAATAVLHIIGTPEGCAVGTWSTFAAQQVLEQRLRVMTIRTQTCGFLSHAAATAEAQQLGVGAVVMAAFETLRLDPMGPGMYHPVGRLRVVVIRDGRVALDRSLDLEGRATQSSETSRAAYDLVTDGFTHLGGALQAVLANAH